jgi:altronate dehydratase large subunit
MSEPREFLGFRRADGQVGLRNHIIIIPSCGCALHTASLIASRVRGAVLLNYGGGCGETDVDTRLAEQILAQHGRHPNVVGSLVVSLGCELLKAAEVVDQIAQGMAPTELLVIQKLGGVRRTVERGVALAERMTASIPMLRREPCPVSTLTVGLECGGSDATSGMAANPAMGAFSDLMVAQGARVILAETIELLGAEDVLARRAIDQDVAQRFLQTIAACEAFLKGTGEDFMGKQPTPGNVLGGISTVEEKALGDALKGGTSPIVDVLSYGQPPRRAGLSFMDTPGNDPASVTAMVAAGSQIVTFTTGRGNPMGNPIAPVVKITGNAMTYAHMLDNMDIDASPIISGRETVEQVGRRIMEFCLQVASGKLTAAEELGHGEFSILRQGPIY